MEEILFMSGNFIGASLMMTACCCIQLDDGAKDTKIFFIPNKAYLFFAFWGGFLITASAMLIRALDPIMMYGHLFVLVVVALKGVKSYKEEVLARKKENLNNH